MVCVALRNDRGDGIDGHGHWTQYRFDPAHHGVNPSETILARTNVRNLNVKWSASVGGGSGPRICNLFLNGPSSRTAMFPAIPLI